MPPSAASGPAAPDGRATRHPSPVTHAHIRRLERIFAAKTALPALPPVHLPRQRLHDLLVAGSRGPLTAIVSPAGYGKTVLATSWVRERSDAGPVAWLTLDPGDNHPATFWPRVVEALRGYLPQPELLDTVPARGGNGWSIQPGSSADVDAVLQQVEHVEVLVEPAGASGGATFWIDFNEAQVGFP